jgi:hypothetical protein
MGERRVDEVAELAGVGVTEAVDAAVASGAPRG